MNEPIEHQAQGISVVLGVGIPFSKPICYGVMKDVSLGGAGILVPAERNIPTNRVLMIRINGIVAKGKLIYQKPLTERLSFVGIHWAETSIKRKVQLYRILRKLIRRARTNHSKEAE